MRMPRTSTNRPSMLVHPCGPASGGSSERSGIHVMSGAVRLGSGWHVREGTGAAGFYRWATDRAEVHVDLTAEPRVAGDAVLELEVEPNPSRRPGHRGAHA